MRRSWPVWTMFVVCLAVVLAPMGWVSLKVVQLDCAEAEARRQTEIDENAGLALWRMDSALAPLVAQETARPYSVYRSLLAVDGGPVGKSSGNEGRSLVASPLAKAAVALVRLHFQIEPDGELTSPRVPVGRNIALAVPNPLSPDEVRKAQGELTKLAAFLQSRHLADRLPPSQATPMEVVQTSSRANDSGSAQSVASNPITNPFLMAAGSQQFQQELDNASQIDAQPAQQRAPLPLQQNVARSQVEFQRRSQAVHQSANYMRQAQVANSAVVATVPSTDLGGVAMTPVWLDDQLFLARRVVVRGREYIQGCWLDWPSLRSALTESIAELLPEARLEPSMATDGANAGRLLAALPIRLIPGELPADEPGGASPLLLSLGIAWACVLVAAGAVAVLLAGVLRLSDRRATFVSAVTHELRTPLTTFHLYTEMLSEGMVEDPQQRQSYLQTLRREAARLTRLVENVLSFSRLERGRYAARSEDVALDELIWAGADRLSAHAREFGMTLCVEVDASAVGAVVRANRSSVEQIVFNLVDNACKYAAAADDKRIHVAAQVAGRRADISVRDHGPGLGATARRRLFRPFSRSAQDAAGTAPGVGLGLALCARLARDMGGRLRLEPADRPGTGFVLQLPACDGRR